jgi:hypothetical protein
MAEHDNYAASLSAFRPSVYSTGLQPIKAYTPGWAEGADYGSWFSEWLEQTGSVGGKCTDHDGLLGKKGATVSCAALYDAQNGNPPGTTDSFDSDGPSITSMLPSIDFPDWAPNIFKDEAEQEEERKRKEDDEKKKFRRNMGIAALGAITVLTALYITQSGAFKKGALAGQAGGEKD